MRRTGRVAAAVLAVATVLLPAACGDGPVEPSLPELEVVPAGGDGQYGAPGEQLPAPLDVLVRRTDGGAPEAGVTVAWAVESGAASLVTAPVGTTGEDGHARAVLRLGTAPGPVRVSATVERQKRASAAFEVFVAERPVLTALSRTTARGGDTLRVEGRGFSALPEQNVVLFSGIRGRVIEASTGSVRVQVPPCLPARDVQVTVQLGGLVSEGLPLAVNDGGVATGLEPGALLDVADPGGFTCLRLVGGGARYLVTVQAAGTVGAARYGYRLDGLSHGGVGVAVAPRAPAAGGIRPGGEVARRFEASLRASEALLVLEGTAKTRVLPARAAAAVPAVGHRRTFQVLNAQARFDTVAAVARHVSTQAAIYLDERAPAGGFSDGDLAAFAATFDQVIHPTDTEAFGEVSDLDGNDRVVILFSPTVNALTPRGADGFVGGFFYGLDLMPDRDGSNRGEIFYALVPDPAGFYSDPRSRDQVLKGTPAILAHELQHMIHFNERILRLGAGSAEALWLSEGLAQMAEELVARVYERRGDPVSTEQYREGNRVRARGYLEDPAAVSLIIATGKGSLEERGAGWLHALYLWDRGGGNEVLRRLTRTTRTGTANVAAVAGATWPELFADWSAALYLDGLQVPAFAFEYPTVRLRDLLRTAAAYPLVPETLGSGDFVRAGSLWSSSVQHYIVVPPASGFVALRLGGSAGASAPADADLRLRVVRLR